MNMEIAVLIWIASIIIGIVYGQKKNEGCASFIGCFLLGPLWLPVVFLSKGKGRICPFCKELTKKDAIVCPHCQRDIGIVTQQKEDRMWPEKNDGRWS